MISVIKNFFLFPFFYYKNFFLILLRSCKNLLILLNQEIAASLMLRYLFVPMFADYTIMGRCLSFIYRVIRGLGGFLIIFTVAVLEGLFLICYLLLPVFLVYYLKTQGLFIILAIDAFCIFISLLISHFSLRQQKELDCELNKRLEISTDATPSSEDKQKILDWLNRRQEWQRIPMLWDKNFGQGALGGVNRALTGCPTPTLDKYGFDLTRQAQLGKIPPIIGKEKPINDTIRVLEKPTKNNVLLLGEPGCGKTSLVSGLASQIVSGSKSSALWSKRVVSLEIGALMSGTKSGGELEGRLKDIIDEIERSGNIILFLDEIHNAVAAGGDVETALIFTALEPHLSSGRLQVIGATSWENYRKFIEPNEAFSRLFEIVEIPEATKEETLAILEITSDQMEKEYKVIISYPALQTIVDLSEKYVQERVLPDAAVDALENTVVYVSKERPNDVVSKADVEKIVSEKTHVPVEKLSETEEQKLLNLEKEIHKHLIDQEEAVTMIADALRRARLGIREEKRPIASLLFVGPTGVGKTETAKVLSQQFFGSEEQMIRFDMSEYQAQETVGDLINKLSDTIRRRPYSLLLLDEFEKAHKDLLTIFLQVLEDSRLTDEEGHITDFTQCLIIATSNAGTQEGYQTLKNDLYGILSKYLRLELLNRFDGIIVFKPLKPEEIEQIAAIKLNKIRESMLAKGYQIDFSPGLIKALANQGFDERLGARPLRRLIQDTVESYLAKAILERKIKKGETTILDESILQNKDGSRLWRDPSLNNLNKMF